MIDFAGTKRVLIFKDFNLLFLPVGHKRWGGRFGGLLTVTMLHNKKLQKDTGIKIHTYIENNKITSFRAK